METRQNLVISNPIRYTFIMAEKDIISKDIIKRLIEDISKYLFNLDITLLEVLETQTQRIEERRADIVVRVKELDREYILHIEVQNNNDNDIDTRMLRYLTDIRLQWPKYEIEQYLIYIGKKELTMKPGIQSRGLDYRYHLINMHDIDCEHFLQSHKPEALIIAILCDFKGRDEREVIHYILSELKRYYKDNEKAFRDSVAMLEVLSLNRELQDIVQEEEDMLSARIDELPSYHIGMERGLEKGKLKWTNMGKIEGKIEIAIKLKKKEYSIDDIIELTGLTQEQIEKL